MLENKLTEVAARIRQAEDGLRKVAAAARKENRGAPESAEHALYFSTAKEPLNLSVVAVDAGLLADRMHGCDIVLGRAVAANFVYKNSVLVSCGHFPAKFPGTEVETRTGLDEHEALVFRQLFRLGLEINTAAAAVEMFSPEFLLLDGSIVPLGSDRPAANSMLCREYERLIGAYTRLFSLCEEKGCQPMGIIKDSRGKRLVELLGLGGLNASDTLFVSFLLEEGERTAVLPYASEKKRTPVLKDLGGFGERISVFYLKPSANDLPLRVEFLQSGKGTRELSSVINSLSSISSSFSYPAVLIEADLCAALEPLEMEELKRSVFSLSGGSVRSLRRSGRPFR